MHLCIIINNNESIYACIDSPWIYEVTMVEIVCKFKKHKYLSELSEWFKKLSESELCIVRSRHWTSVDYTFVLLLCKNLIFSESFWGWKLSRHIQWTGKKRWENGVRASVSNASNNFYHLSKFKEREFSHLRLWLQGHSLFLFPWNIDFSRTTAT